MPQPQRLHSWSVHAQMRTLLVQQPPQQWQRLPVRLSGREAMHLLWQQALLAAMSLHVLCVTRHARQ
jgi:hypothetical protein